MTEIKTARLPDRIAVVGHSGAGKSTLADVLATRAEAPRFDLDELMRTESWHLRPEAEFRRLVEASAAGDRWVASGDAGRVRRLLWQRAQSVIWLDLPWTVIALRFWRRLAKQGEAPERVWGPRGPAIHAFASRARLLPDTLIDHALRARQIERLLGQPRLRHLEVVRLRTPLEVERWLASLPNGSPVAVAREPS